MTTNTAVVFTSADLSKAIDGLGYELSCPKKGEIAMTVTVGDGRFELPVSTIQQIVDYGVRRVAQDRTTKSDDRTADAKTEFARIVRGYFTARDEKAAQQPETSPKSGGAAGGISQADVVAYLDAHPAKTSSGQDAATVIANLDGRVFQAIMRSDELPEYLREAVAAIREEKARKLQEQVAEISAIL